jgi:hypothetical protein
VTHTSALIALAVALSAAVATMGIGAFLLRNAVNDASDLASALPTRLIKDDTSEARESTRWKALIETLWLLGLRSMPGSVLIICGAGVFVWTCARLLPLFVS